MAPTTVTGTLTQVNISLSDLNTYLASEAAKLIPANCHIKSHQRNGPNDPVPDGLFDLYWVIERADLTTFLTTIIPNLPAAYGVRLVQTAVNPTDTAAVVSWTTM